MWQGKVVSLQITQEASGPMCAIEAAHTVPGKGIEGDRYFSGLGTYSNMPGPHREITLIELEAIEAIKREYNINLEPRQSRRNIVTRGVPLNHLVGREFRIDGVTLRGILLCEPCMYLESLTQAKVMKSLVHRGGLRAQILSEGIIRPGDSVEVL